jgi:hypothetical protein
MFAFARAVLGVSVIFGAGVFFAFMAPEQTQSAVKSFEEITQFKLPEVKGRLQLKWAEQDECQKWAEKGDEAMKGCSKCVASFPGRTDQCMSCGGICMKKTCTDKSGADCYESPAFQSCHSACMAKDGDKVAEYVKAWEDKKAWADKKEAWADKKVDKEECYFDEECRKLVDWELVKKVKAGFFERAKKLTSQEDQLKPLSAGVHARLVKAGYPEDRAWHTVRTWAEYVAKEQKKDLPAEKKDCYFDPECHKLVDWKLVTEAKMDFFARAKKLQSTSEVRPLAAGLRERLLKAGVPEDRADMMVGKWFNGAVKDYEPEQPATAGVSGECAKYEEKGPLAVSGCAKCADYYPGRTEECMTCGGVCARKVCEESELGECVKTPPFVECHKACMAKDTAAPESRSNVKMLKLHAQVSTFIM